MIPELREQYNRDFTRKKYEAFLADLSKPYPGEILFRVAETPVFVPEKFTGKMIDACETIVDLILNDDFKRLTERAIPGDERVPGDDGNPGFIAFDFGVCTGEKGELEPQLIEMQGFPTLFAFQAYYPEVMRRHFDIPANFSQYLGGYDKERYLRLLKDIIVGDHNPENVILLEVKPHEQKTKIDFYCTHDYLGIPVVGLSELKKKGRELFYSKDGRDIRVERIYNRIIFDDLHHLRNGLGDIIDLTQPLDVEWAIHPNWFYRVSKFTLPFIKQESVPQTFFLNEMDHIPGDLENYVLKPLFSFAGQGVVINVKRQDIDNITDPENWILQRKVNYTGVIPTPDIPSKAEIRIFYFWDDKISRPVPVCNLARLSKGDMIGVRYNADKEWVGGSVAFFENTAIK